jgi:hypothetical protein
MLGKKMITSSFSGAVWVSDGPTPPHEDTWRLGWPTLVLWLTCLGAWADLPLRWVRPVRHVALRLACPCPGHEPAWAPTWGHLALGLPTLALGQSRVPGGVGVDFPCPGREPGSCPHMRTPDAWVACPFTGSDPHTTWHWSWLALFPRLRVKLDVAQGPNMIKKI